MDIPKHGEPAYPNAAYGHGWDTEGLKGKYFKLSCYPDILVILSYTG